MFLNLGKGPGCHYPAPGYGIHSIYIYTPHSILTIWPFPTSHPVAFSLFRYRSTFGHRLTRAPEPFASRPSLEPEAPCAQPRHAVDTRGQSPQRDPVTRSDSEKGVGSRFNVSPGEGVLERGVTFGGLLGGKIDCIDIHI